MIEALTTKTLQGKPERTDSAQNRKRHKTNSAMLVPTIASAWGTNLMTCISVLMVKAGPRVRLDGKEICTA